MAVTMHSQFSENGKYFAQLSTDGKLKIWNTFTNSLEQEFTPDYHLTSPCTCLYFLPTDTSKNKLQSASPKKKKRRNSELPSQDPNIALGTSSGLLLLYSISKANLEYSLTSGTSKSICCLSSIDNTIVYSGEEQNVLVWNLDKRKLQSKWKVGNEKVTSILALPEDNQILTASKTIKLWDVETKEVLKTFTGHSSEVIFLQYVVPSGREEGYFISGSKGDRILNCWKLSAEESDKNAVAGFLMEDIVQSISVQNGHDGSTNLAATVRSGVVHVYQHTLNGKSNKPFKPKTTVQVVSDTGQTKDVVVPLRITGAVYRDDDSLCIGYGTEVLITFESLAINTEKKVQCLVRRDPRTVSSVKAEQSSKIITPSANNAHYVTTQRASVGATPASKRKSDVKMEMPMERRLENLTLNAVDGSKVPKGDNVAQLLVQGLHSKDKSILFSVLSRRDENVIRNSVKRLPVTVLEPLIQELNRFIQGKTLSTQIGAVWLKHIIQTHAAILSSNPNLPELLQTTLVSVDSRLHMATKLNRLKGRLDLLIPQVSSSSTEEACLDEEPVLIFKDKDSSDSEAEELEMDQRSGSENEWEEEEEESEGDEQPMENNVESDSDSAMSE